MAPNNAVPQQSLPPWEIDHHNGDYVPHSFQTVCGFFNVTHNLHVQGLWDDAQDLLSLSGKTRLQAPVVWKVDNAIHSINLYPVDNVIGFPNTYLLDSNLSGG